MLNHELIAEAMYQEKYHLLKGYGIESGFVTVKEMAIDLAVQDCNNTLKALFNLEVVTWAEEEKKNIAHEIVFYKRIVSQLENM